VTRSSGLSIAPARLGHIDLEVRDIARSLRFYDRFLPALGFRRVARGKNFLVYGKGRVHFEIVASPSPRVVRRPPKIPSQRGMVVHDHIAFRVPSLRGLRELERRIVRTGLKPLWRVDDFHGERPGFDSAVWVDPDNVVWELSRYLPSRG
jgi:catechol 2,3-dioxygenase-like lactoylglutathione lyase family enzyme